MKAARILFILAVVAAAGAGVYWYGARPAVVSTVSPTRGDAARIVYATGVIEPRNWAKVTSLVRERIVDVCNCEGSEVAKGDPLARLDETEAAAELAELEARHRLAVAERDRIARLVERNVVNLSEMDRVQSEVTRIEASIAGQKARLANYVLRAPSDGVILRQDAEIGEIAEAGAVLFWVGQPLPLIVVAEVNEEDIPDVETGQRAFLQSGAFPARDLESVVDSITPKGDPVTKTYRVRLKLPPDTPLMIGMTVDVNIVTQVSENALLVPSLALRDDAVFVVEDGIARRRNVAVGIKGTTDSEVLSGLTGDEAVISPYPEALDDGGRVTVGGG